MSCIRQSLIELRLRRGVSLIMKRTVQSESISVKVPKVLRYDYLILKTEFSDDEDWDPAILSQLIMAEATINSTMSEY
jgi:hypothetical protein